MDTHLCTVCHTAIPQNAPAGLCPACVLREAAESPLPNSNAPSIEEIAAEFPMLREISLIGQGGMGFVYKARQINLDRIIALKILAPGLSRDPAFAERFAREARTLGKLQNPGIVSVFEYGNTGTFYYLIMEYVDGLNLRQLMQAGRLSPEQALSLVPGICDALQAAHAQGVCHRDIKPENILLDREGRAKIADFGIARIAGDSAAHDFTLTFTGNALGTAAYMAPEQHEQPHNVDHRADIYSLGVVVYEMLTGELPLGRFPLPSERAAVNARVDEIVLRTLEKQRELRQQSADEFKTDVGQALKSGGASAIPSRKPAADKASEMAKMGFKFLLIGFVGFPVEMAIMDAVGWPQGQGNAFLFSMFIVFIALTLGLMTRHERLGKIVTITSGFLLLLCLLFLIYIYLPIV